MHNNIYYVAFGCWTSEGAWSELPAWLSSEQASKVSMSTQLNLHHLVVSALKLALLLPTKYNISNVFAMPPHIIILWPTKCYKVDTYLGLYYITLGYRTQYLGNTNPGNTKYSKWSLSEVSWYCALRVIWLSLSCQLFGCDVNPTDIYVD